jgi:pimeloyl-ACP methyl ester carboxylesterase
VRDTTNQPMRHYFLVLLITGLTAACQPVIRPPEPTPLAAQVSPGYGRFVKIGERTLFLYCIGEGSPTVLLEAGLGGDHSAWAMVQPETAAFAHVCSYDRANTGLSDAAPTPRTSADVVADLHALLSAAALPGPYILVGHSFGALHVRLYAHTYPAEVAGLVLVDPVHEDWWRRAAALIPPAAPADSARLQTFRRFMNQEVNNPAHTPEGIDIPASADQLRTTDGLGALPLIIVKAGIQDILAPGLPADLESELDQLLQKELSAELELLSSLSIQLDVPDSGHDIPRMQPDAVVVAIRTMIDVMQLTHHQ